MTNTTGSYPDDEATTDLSLISTQDVGSGDGGAVDTGSSGGGRSGVEIYLIAFKITIGLIGMIGNLTVLLVIKQMATQKVKFLICSQAMIDFLTSFVLVADTFTTLYPTAPPQNIVIGYLYCWLWPTQLILFGLFSASTWNLVAISIERYFAVMHAMWYRINFSETKATVMGVIAWIIAPTMQITYVAIKRERYVNGECIDNKMPPTTQIIVGVFIFLWDFFLPCMIMGFCFTRISLSLSEQDRQAKTMRAYTDKEMSTVSRKVSNNATDDAAAETRENKNKKRVTATKSDSMKKDTSAEMSRSRNVTQTFVKIFVVFVICWITNQCLFFQYNLGGYRIWGRPENHFANSMAILNSACNPFIYVLNMKAYREKLRGFCKIS